MATEKTQEKFVMTTKNKIWPWLIVVGFGVMNAMTMQLIMSNSGIFIAPITKELGFARSAFTLWVTILTLCIAVGVPIMGRILPKFDVRITLSCAFVVCLGAWSLNSFGNSMFYWYVTAVFEGLGGAFVFAQAMPIITGNWFAKNKGLIIGCTYMVSAGIAAILAPTGAAIIQAYGWRTAYLMLGGISAVCVLPFTLFIFRFKPEDMGMKPWGYDPNAEETTEVGGENTPGLTCNRAMKTGAFWLLFILGGMVTLFGGFTKSLAAAALTWGYDAMFGAYLTSIVALYRYFSPVAGFLADKLGALKAMLIWLTVIFIGFMLFIFCNQTQALVIAATICLAFQSSMQNTFMPTITRQVFGSKDYSKVFSTIAMGFSIIGAFGTPIVNLFYDMAGSYTGSFYFGAGICVVAAIIAICASVLGKKVTWEE